jgi:hypothetical protein
MLRGALFGAFLVLALTSAVVPADMPVSTPPDLLEVPAQSARDYVEGRALLHTIRSVFDVEAAEDLPALVAADAAAVADGVTPEQSRELQVDLIAEGSYFLTSLRYLIEAGFPNWPEDRSAGSYERDARMMLEKLPEQLITTVLAGEDPIAIFTTAAQVYWWTEGASSPSDLRGDFSQRDALVDNALAGPAVEKETL